MKFEPLSKRADDPNAKKRREVNIGLANNATGAAFGAIATGQAAAMARSNYKRLKADPNAPTPPPKPNLAQRGYRSLAGRSQRVARLGARVKPHLTGKNAAKGALVLGGLNVAGQLANAGLDAQSGVYFARERSRLSRKNIEKADNGIGTFYERVKSRTYPAWEDPNARRQRELGVATGAGAALGVQGAVRTARAMRDMELTYPTRTAQGQAIKGKEIKVKPLKELRNGLMKNPRTRRGLAMAGVGLPVAALSYRLSHGSNERPWS